MSVSYTPVTPERAAMDDKNGDAQSRRDARRMLLPSIDRALVDAGLLPPEEVDAEYAAREALCPSALHGKGLCAECRELDGPTEETP